MQAAVAALAREGLIRTVPGRGSFVAQAAPAAPVDLGWQAVVLGARPTSADALDRLLAPPGPGAIALSSGYPDPTLQPVGALRAALARAARRPGTWGRMPVEGHPDLRAWFAREAGAGLSAADTLIVPGGQAALTVIFRALLVPGAPMLIESPTYPGAVAVARAMGCAAVPVPVDHEGLRPDLLDATFRATGAHVVYTQPTFHNPTGALQSEARRRAILEVAARHDAFVVEDDFAHDLASGPVPPTLVSRDPGRVVYVRSLTKSAAPSLRVAAVCARGPVFARLRAARIVDDFFVSGVLQETALDLITSSAWRSHLRQLVRVLGERRDAALASALPFWIRPEGGLNLWLPLPPGSDDIAIARDLETRGVALSPGRLFYPADPEGPALRVSIAGAPIDGVREGVARIVELLRAQR